MIINSMDRKFVSWILVLVLVGAIPAAGKQRSYEELMAAMHKADKSWAGEEVGDLELGKLRLDYLKRLNERYEAWVSTYDKGKLLIIDIDDINFKDNKEDLGNIINAVDAEIHGLFEKA